MAIASSSARRKAEMNSGMSTGTSALTRSVILPVSSLSLIHIYHVVQVAVGGHFNVHLVPTPGDMAVRDGAHGVPVGGSRRARRAQGQKIVGAHELLRRRLHGGFVQPPGHAGVVGGIKGRVDGVVMDAVQVGLCLLYTSRCV